MRSHATTLTPSRRRVHGLVRERDGRDADEPAVKAFYAEATRAHAPQHFYLRGVRKPNEERPERAERLLAALAHCGIEAEEPAPSPHAAVAAVHTPRYLDFLANGHAEWEALEGAGEEVVMNVVPRLMDASYPAGIVGRAGWHMGDLGCPLGPHTAEAAFRSADCALAATHHVAAGARAAYALCRPPGHHASAEVAGGHCFLNNAAIAAQALLERGARPAVLDIDVHHGNGTQAIFYARADVLTVSVHATTEHFYPWYTGRAHETGAGAGAGYNLNLPLPLRSEDAVWHAAIDEALAAVATFGADILVLALGLDVHHSDPLGGLAVSTEGIGKAGERVAAAGLKTVITQEGGYLSDALADNLAAFLAGFERAA